MSPASFPSHYDRDGGRTMSKRILRAAVFTLVAALAGGAIAAPGQLVLVIAGEAYDGPPKFEVSFNGAVLGQGTVETAIDTANGGRFADAAEQTTHQQTFEFAIPEEAFSPGGEVRVRFLNEAFGGEGSNRDRNLFIQSLTVNGLQVPAPKLATVSSAGIEPNTILGEYLATGGAGAGPSTVNHLRYNVFHVPSRRMRSSVPLTNRTSPV